MVAVIHAKLVHPAVMSAVLANTTAVLPENETRFRRSVTAAATVMATISLQAFTRHQYQRRIYTAPVPMPRFNTICHPWLIELNCPAMYPLISTRTIVSNLPTFT